jgi:hypothetical protein
LEIHREKGSGTPPVKTKQQNGLHSAIIHVVRKEPGKLEQLLFSFNAKILPKLENVESKATNFLRLKF